VPVFSWLLARGRCRYCGARVSAAYPLIECATGLCAAGLAAALGLTWAFAAALVALPFVVAAIGMLVLKD